MCDAEAGGRDYLRLEVKLICTYHGVPGLMRYQPYVSPFESRLQLAFHMDGTSYKTGPPYCRSVCSSAHMPPDASLSHIHRKEPLEYLGQLSEASVSWFLPPQKRRNVYVLVILPAAG